MLEFLDFMAAPLVVLVPIIAIHVFLGIHILQREVIFVDLALAQMAALGTTVAFVIGLSHDGTASYVFSLGFVVMGAVLFALTRVAHQRVPQEAIIGIAYIVATAATIMVADQAAGGADHIKEVLTGALLWITWPGVFQILGVYAVLGVFYFIFRKRFDGLTARYRGGVFQPGDRLWDFLFYFTFGLVIVMSVRVVGILLVFSFLVVPSSAALICSRRWGTQILIGWAIAMLSGVLGLYLSYTLDVPSGPVIVVLLGIALALFALCRRLIGMRGVGGGTSGLTGA